MRDIQPQKKTPRMTGEKVPVTAIHGIPEEKVVSQKRPLFYKKELSTRTRRGRIGHKERYIVLGILGLLAVVVVLALALFLPVAKVDLVLRTAPLLIEHTLTLEADEARGSGGSVPGIVFFRELNVEGEASVVSTEVIGTKARGTVEVVNRSIETQSIVERSRLVTSDEVLFYLTRAVTVPPNSRVSVEVEAAESGVEGNISPQRLDFAALEGSARSLVYAESKREFTGGTGETVHVVQESDLEQAREAAKDKARSLAAPDIREELTAGWIIMEESWVVDVQALETSAEVGERSPVISYSGRAVVRALGYEQAVFEERLQEALEARLSDDYMLFPGPITYTSRVDEADWERGRAEITARVTHMTIPRMSIDSLREKLSGRSRDDAVLYLEGLPGVRSAKVDLEPFWVRSVPRIERRIRLNLEAEQQPI